MQYNSNSNTIAQKASDEKKASPGEEDNLLDTEEHSCSSSIGQEECGDLDEDCSMVVSSVASGVHNGNLIVTPTHVKVTFNQSS